jgi:hypothetical protein
MHPHNIVRVPRPNNEDADTSLVSLSGEKKTIVARYKRDVRGEDRLSVGVLVVPD